MNQALTDFDKVQAAQMLDIFRGKARDGRINLERLGGAGGQLLKMPVKQEV